MCELSKNSSENAAALARIIGPERNFDIVNKKINVGGRPAEFFMIDGFIRNLREQLCAEGEKLALIATGGYCNAIIPHCRNKFQIVDDLTLIGASLLYKRNKK